MSQKRSKPAPPALDPAWVQRVADRLRGEFARVLDQVPPTTRTATKLSRVLGLPVPTCHRVLAGTRQTGAPALVIEAFPGVDGLNSFLRAVAKKLVMQPETIEAARSAVRELDQLLEASGGSRRRLMAAVGRPPAPTGPGASLANLDDARAATFQGMTQQMGCSARLVSTVRIYHDAAQPRFTGDVDVVNVLGRCGYRRESPALPILVAHSSKQGQGSTAPDPQEWLLKEFCTQPLPNFTVERRGDLMLGVADPARERIEPLDVFAGPIFTRNVGADHDGAVIVNAATLVRCPAEHLLSDAFVPRRWAANLACSAHAVAMGSLGGVEGPIAQRWFDRLPVTMTPGYLGRGLTNVATELWDRHTDLTRRTFELNGLNPDDYIGYRLHVRFPIVFAQYVLNFEYRLSGTGS